MASLRASLRFIVNSKIILMSFIEIMKRWRFMVDFKIHLMDLMEMMGI